MIGIVAFVGNLHLISQPENWRKIGDSTPGVDDNSMYSVVQTKHSSCVIVLSAEATRSPSDCFLFMREFCPWSKAKDKRCLESGPGLEMQNRPDVV